MNANLLQPRNIFAVLRELTACLCIVVLGLNGGSLAVAQTQQAAPAPADQAAGKLPADQLDSLVAPIALYPDPMLSQVLIASTYPLEVIQLKQWLDQNKSLKDKALADAVEKQHWDPSIQSLAGLPEVVKLLSENIKWTTDLGNAFLAQQDDVMTAVQRMRQKAQSNGNLKSSEQQKVEVKTVESKQVIVIQQASPEVVYVPSYNPTVVYGAPVYAYPPIAYPPPGYYAAGMAISFGVGVAMGAFWGGGGWCCNSSWNGGNNNININNNNNFVRNSNRQNVGNGNRASTRPAGGNSSWQHNPQHRGGAPYGDRGTANKFGGTTRGDSMQNRQANARQNIGRDQQAGNFGNRNPGGAGDRGGVGNNRGGVGDNRGGAGGGGVGNNRGGVGDNRGGAGGGGGAGNRDMSNRAGGGNMGGNRGGGGDRVGNQRVPNYPSGGNRSAFGGAGSGMSGSSARASQSRGSSSMGGSRGGGSRGGGGRGGGGGRRR
jgi:hypothetical protein